MTMKIILNGRREERPGGSSLEDVVRPFEAGGVKFAALVNGQVIPRNMRAARPLRDGDHVELLSLAGGG